MAVDATETTAATRRHRTLAFLLVVVFTALVLGYYHDRFWWPPDEGIDAHVADRILDGEVLNLDVQDIHPGYHNFANALALWLFGDDLVSLRYPLVAMGFLQSLLVFFLLLPRGTLVAAAGSVSVTALSLVQFLNPTANWYGLFLFIAIVCAVNWLPRDARWRLEALGFLVITLVLFRQLTGVIVAIGVLSYLLCEAPRGARGNDRLLARALVAVMAGGLGAYLLAKTDPLAIVIFGVWPLGVLAWAWFAAAVANRCVLRLVFRFGLGGVAAAAPLVLYHVLYGSLAIWFDDTVVAAMSLTELGFIGKMTYGTFLDQGLRQAIAFDSIAGVVNGLFWAVLTLVAMAHGFLVLRALSRTGKTGPALHPLPFLTVFYAVVSVQYQIPIYLFFTVGISLAGLLWMTAGGSSWRRHLPVALACALSAVGLYYHAAQPLSRGLSGTFLGERIALEPARGLDRASLWMEAADVRLYTHLVELVEREVGPEETILAIPLNPELYFLTRRRNPFRFYNSALGVRNDDDLLEAWGTLARAPPRLVFYQPGDKYNTPYSLKIMRFVKPRYELLEMRGGFEIYRYPAATNKSLP